MSDASGFSERDSAMAGGADASGAATSGAGDSVAGDKVAGDKVAGDKVAGDGSSDARDSEDGAAGEDATDEVGEGLVASFGVIASEVLLLATSAVEGRAASVGVDGGVALATTGDSAGLTAGVGMSLGAGILADSLTFALLATSLNCTRAARWGERDGISLIDTTGVGAAVASERSSGVDASGADAVEEEGCGDGLAASELSAGVACDLTLGAGIAAIGVIGGKSRADSFDSLMTGTAMAMRAGCSNEPLCPPLGSSACAPVAVGCKRSA